MEKCGVSSGRCSLVLTLDGGKASYRTSDAASFPLRTIKHRSYKLESNGHCSACYDQPENRLYIIISIIEPN